MLGREERVFNLGTVYERLTDSTDCAAMRRPHISTWALRHRDMLHDIAEAAAAGRGRQKGRSVADNFSAGNLLAGNLCDD